jgi:carboxyl-terminal processing protease
MAQKDLRNIIFALAAAATTAACGGGGTPTSGGGGTPTSGTPPTPPTSGTCSLRARQDFAFSVLDEWYLFPETLPASRDPSTFTTVESYIDALTATARGQGRDRFFTFLTSIEQENAFFSSGATAGFGIRLSFQSGPARVLIAEAFEGAPALAAGIDRGTEILAIGTTESNLRNVSDIIAAEGNAGVSAALGPSTAGTIRVLRVTDAAGPHNLTISKADFELTPVSSRYGATVINDGTRRVAYINLRTFISSADDQLRSAFANYRAQGITDYIIDFRYNGGGLISTAGVMYDLLGGARSTSDIASVQSFRPSKASRNETRRFAPNSRSVRPVRIAFIGTSSTASASELVMNTFVPYLGVNAALIGADTSGKPVGQIALDQATCDDRIRVVAFSTQNSANQGFYYDGMASVMRATCQAPDDLTKPLGDPTEGSVRTALDFIAGRACTPIAGGTAAKRIGTPDQRELLTPDAPTPAQREVPGLF